MSCPVSREDFHTSDGTGSGAQEINEAIAVEIAQGRWTKVEDQSGIDRGLDLLTADKTSMASCKENVKIGAEVEVEFVELKKWLSDHYVGQSIAVEIRGDLPGCLIEGTRRVQREDDGKRGEGTIRGHVKKFPGSPESDVEPPITIEVPEGYWITDDIWVWMRAARIGRRDGNRANSTAFHQMNKSDSACFLTRIVHHKKVQSTVPVEIARQNKLHT